ncbi:MAG: hypothetical protein JXR96_12710 [Deltaproteobacteria bacterium]|nr:hypothetical protein [Deltaproteobacteria bacterium]
MRRVWIPIAALALASLGICLLWPKSPEIETPVEPEPEPVSTPSPLRERPAEALPAESVQAIDPAELLRVLEELSKSQQAMEDWYRELARVCERLTRSGHYDEALQCLLLFGDSGEDNADFHRLLGEVHQLRGEDREAYWCNLKYLELEPDGPHASAIRLRIDEYERRLDEKSPPEDVEERLRQAKLLYEEAYILHAKSAERAVRRLQRALELLPEGEQVYRSKIEKLLERIESGPD